MSDLYTFSQIYRHSSPSSCLFSPGTTFFANCIEDHIIVRKTQTMELVRTWHCQRPSTPSGVGGVSPERTSTGREGDGGLTLKSLAWSPTSSHLLAFCPSSSSSTRGSSGSGSGSTSGVIWVFSLSSLSSDPIAVISAGIEGLRAVEWSPNGEEVLAWSEQNLRITIYNLSNERISYINSPKSTTNCHAYRPTDNRYLAIAEKHKGKDYLGVYDAGDMYNLVRSFPLATNDVHGVSWSPCGRWIAVWDNHLDYALHIHSPLSPLLLSLTPTSPSFLGPDPGLGIRCVAWGPGGKWVGVGGWDGKLRIVEAEGWRCVCTIDPLRRRPGKDTTLWKEPSGWYADSRGSDITSFSRMNSLGSWPALKIDVNKPLENVGISRLEWNIDGTLFYVQHDTIPNVLQIYTFLPSPTSPTPTTLHLHTSILLTDPIKQIKWNPVKAQRLAIITLAREENLRGFGSGVFLWDGEWMDEEERWVEGEGRGSGIMEAVPVPMASFNTHDIKWAPDGESLSIMDKHQFCVLYDDTQKAIVESPRSEIDERAALSVIEE